MVHIISHARSQDYAQFHGGRALELQVGGGGEANEKLFGRYLWNMKF
jgi:hypothetical protein